MLIIERHQQDEWCWWFSCYVHYLKTWRILEGSIRDFLDFVSEEKPEKKYNRTYTFLVIQSVNEYNLKLIALKKIVHPERVGGGTQHNFIRESSNPRSHPLPFYIPFLT